MKTKCDLIYQNGASRPTPFTVVLEGLELYTVLHRLMLDDRVCRDVCLCAERDVGVYLVWNEVGAKTHAYRLS